MRFALSCAAVLLAFLSPTATAEETGTPPPTPIAFLRPDTAALLTPENVAKLEAGQTLSFKVGMDQKSGSSKGGGTVMVLVNRPWETLWAYLLDHTTYAEYLPRVKSVECYLNEPNKLGLKISARIVIRGLVQHVINTLDKENLTITWVLDQSKKNDIRDTAGAWMLVPHGEGKTILVYAIQIDMGWAMPNWLENFMIRRDLPGFVESLKDYAESKPAITMPAVDSPPLTP